METTNIILCGLGGQGVLFMTRILAETAMHRGQKVVGAETHGMAQRGGSVISHLRLGEAEGSLIRSGTAHYLLALDEHEAYRYLPFLAKGGKLYVNVEPGMFPRPEVGAHIKSNKIVYRCVAATKIALDLGAPMSTNLALLGYFAGFDDGPFSGREIRQTVERVSPERFREMNLKVFDSSLETGERT
ncbi:MAG: indolepyruvate ferredoxin oxidoreductase [Deltaproteobacteria bacterium]|nr:MAG: indolepyruvate ferredoxin oxidoreductase [Deltaproteobacteria bacterium]